jgi:hypothetical protein
MENIDCNYRLRGPRLPFGTKDQAAHYRTVRCQRKVNRGDHKIQTHQSLHQNFIVRKVSNTSMYLIMINALCNGCACSAVNRLEKETGKRTFPQRRFRSPMKGFDSYDFWPYNVPLFAVIFAFCICKCCLTCRLFDSNKKRLFSCPIAERPLHILLMSSTNARTRMMEIDELIRIMSRLRIAILFVWLGDTLNDWFEWQ